MHWARPWEGLETALRDLEAFDHLAHDAVISMVVTRVTGMVTTIEPGIYIPSSANVDDKWKGIGIRIEDDILVTPDGNENLTEFVPSDPKEIEALMA